MQNKHQEIDFFSNAAQNGFYNVFSDKSNLKIVSRLIGLGNIQTSEEIIDLGCGSGIFTNLFYTLGYHKISGFDLCNSLIELAQNNYPSIKFVNADIEKLPLESSSVDIVVFSAVLHHFPDLTYALKEAYRVLKPGGRFVAFDPNRQNPFMWLYRDKNSPFYSSCGVTENERPIIASELVNVGKACGFNISIDYLSGLEYKYVKSTTAAKFLPIYNLIDCTIFDNNLLKQFAAFVISIGTKFDI